jgi:hypothetical protein
MNVAVARISLGPLQSVASPETNPTPQEPESPLQPECPRKGFPRAIFRNGSFHRSERGHTYFCALDASRKQSKLSAYMRFTTLCMGSCACSCIRSGVAYIWTPSRLPRTPRVIFARRQGRAGGEHQPTASAYWPAPDRVPGPLLEVLVCSRAKP